MNILEFKTLSICRFGSGTLLGLDERQVKRRRHMLDDTDQEGVYLTRQPVEFKAGEAIKVDPDTLGKSMLRHMDDLGRSEAAEKAAKLDAMKKAAQPKAKKGRGRPKATENL